MYIYIIYIYTISLENAPESGRGVSRSSGPKLPAQASRLVKNALRLKSSFAVAQMELSSNSEVGVGPESTVAAWHSRIRGSEHTSVIYLSMQMRAY